MWKKQRAVSTGSDLVEYYTPYSKQKHGKKRKSEKRSQLRHDRSHLYCSIHKRFHRNYISREHSESDTGSFYDSDVEYRSHSMKRRPRHHKRKVSSYCHRENRKSSGDNIKRLLQDRTRTMFIAERGRVVEGWNPLH